VDAKHRIGYLSPSKHGARHDKRLLDQRQVIANIPSEVSILADSGFQGLRHPSICLPRKGRKKRPLETSPKRWNTLLAGLRVVVEHGIGGMKRYNAASGVYRNRLPQTDDKFNLLSAGLWNFYIN
jgi:hypothetical protein